MRKIKLTRANKIILLKALGDYYYRQRAMNTGWRETGYLILKVDSLPVGKKAVFTSEEVRHARSAVNPASAFFFFASPIAIPVQKISPRLFSIATSAPERIVPNPFVTGLSRNGKISISLAFVKTFPRRSEGLQ